MRQTINYSAPGVQLCCTYNAETFSLQVSFPDVFSPFHCPQGLLEHLKNPLWIGLVCQGKGYRNIPEGLGTPQHENTTNL